MILSEPRLFRDNIIRKSVNRHSIDVDFVVNNSPFMSEAAKVASLKVVMKLSVFIEASKAASKSFPTNQPVE